MSSVIPRQKSVKPDVQFADGYIMAFIPILDSKIS